MKNKANIEEDEFDSMPKHVSSHTEDMSKGFLRLYNHRNLNLPNDRIKRYLISRVNRSWADILSEFVKLDWIPVRYRNMSTLKEFVKVNTFWNKDGICFYDSYNSDCFYPIEKQVGEVFYLYPITEILCRKQGSKRMKWKSFKNENVIVLGELNQLIKLDGIWYHVYVNPKDTLNKIGEFNNGALLENNGSHLFISTDKLYRVPIQKKQLCAQELKNFKLKN